MNIHIPWERLTFDERGLIPAIIQDGQSKDVLMMAYMNRESLEKTLETGETWFWSRSRQELWHKGGTSGNIQKVISIFYDCDGDTLLIQVIPEGPACHEGTYSCFTHFGKDGSQTRVQSQRFEIIQELESLIAKREAEKPEGAYTTYLFEKGIDKILKKVGEETSEVIIAAKNHSHEELRYEIADLIYHMMVLMREEKLPLDDVLTELARRHKK
ncbi:bifunctional phosphoribosyl-AMP cyclohydrolase/phosphoribosyl-ATP diphosphatase HisIE [Microaerobacter geothermalis]|uniref:bifunctional phosphoribosyl-AMP cyclohydrolase/phosphoribosyl-ATP diphosphatase HisIE n=1 Tax=Microaerobacter geothermalis TaxID=674972 RepID=UPI001F1C4995|nr:bifunctional phosphoribosyl-AMP cyclohydrolase/phosphoribosyl-ATP diphosphatase HisIE [Microaerobacter geothermalis]MCF6094573.1 bifunctional phosphoribosyl-AMP cyclohydrolase/phosphoribosyl-ATP diphosphatase HisIE [Microaerobacter geothermalis]